MLFLSKLALTWAFLISLVQGGYNLGNVYLKFFRLQVNSAKSYIFDRTDLDTRAMIYLDHEPV